MNRKIFNVAVSFALMFSMLGAVACTTAVDQSEKIEYTLDGVDNLTASFGEPYSAPQYKILRNGTDTGYKAKLQSVTDPDGEAVTVSYSSFTLGQIGTYTMTYLSVGLVGSEFTDVKEEISFEVELVSEDKTGPTITVSNTSEYCIWTGREIGVPAHTAADASGVKGESKVYVELPDGTREDITGKDTYTPKVAGTHYWVFTASDMLDNISEKKLKFEVVGAPVPEQDVIAYFEQEFGANQIEAYNGNLSFDADHVWPDGSKGGTVFTTTVKQDDLPSQVAGEDNGYAIDYVGAFELRQPYIKEVTKNYDTIVLPIYNPNDYYISFRAWWYSVVTVGPGETVYYAIPSAFFEVGDMDAGNYTPIYDVTNMLFAFCDRWYSFGRYEQEDGSINIYDNSYHLPAGAQLIIGNLTAMNYAGKNVEGETYYVADFDGEYANSHIEAYDYYQTTYQSGMEIEDEKLGITGALVLTADVNPQEEYLQDSGCAITIDFTKYSLEELQSMMSPNDYVSFYAKTTSRNTANKPLLGIDYQSIALPLTDEWQEVRIYKSQIHHLFPDVGMGDGTKNITINLFTANGGSTDIEGLEVAITSLKLHINQSAEGTFEYRDDEGNDFVFSSPGAQIVLDEDNVAGDDTSSVKVTFSEEAPGDRGETVSTITIKGDFIREARETADALIIPVYNGNPDTTGEMFVSGNGGWDYYLSVKGQSWGEFVVNIDDWDRVTNSTQPGEITIYLTNYYVSPGKISANVGNLYSETYVVDPVEDELVYFDINAGARQAEGIRADLSYDTNVKFENQAGSTKVVSQVDGTGGEADMRFGVRFKNPYIKDIAEYDYLEIPIYNANDYDIQMKCWWSNHVLLKKGEWTKVILSASVVSGGYFNDLDYSSAAPWNSGKFFIAFIDGDGGAIQTDCTVYLGAMMGKKLALENNLIDLTKSASILEESAYNQGKQGLYVSNGTAQATEEGLKVTTSNAAYVKFNPADGFTLTATQTIVLTVKNTSSTRMVLSVDEYYPADCYVEPGKTATILIYGDELCSRYEGKFGSVEADMKGFTIKLFNGEDWADTLPEGSSFVVTQFGVVDGLGGSYCYRN